MNEVKRMIQMKRVTKINISPRSLRLIKGAMAANRSLNPTEKQKRFLETLYSQCTQGFIEFRPLPTENDRHWINVKQLSVPPIPNNKDVYIGVATRLEGKGDKSAIVEIPAVWVDIDFKDTPEKEAIKRLNTFQPKPTISVSSGNGWHLYWVLKSPATAKDINLVEDVNRRLAQHFNADASAVDASRILRLPGTHNFKHGLQQPVKMWSWDPRRLYSLAEFNLPPTPKKEATPGSPIDNWYTDSLKGVREGRRHNATVHITSSLLTKGMPKVATDIILSLWNERNNPPLSERELQSTIDDIYRRYSPGRIIGMPPDTDEAVSITIPDVISRSIIPAKDFIQMSFPQRRYILSPWLQEGDLVMISAHRGIGKTWLALLIGLAATRKMSIGQWKTDTPVGCLHIDGEMAKDDLQSRLKALEISFPPEKEPFNVMSADLMKANNDPAPNIGDPNWRDYLTAHLDENKHIHLLILDNRASLAPGLNENEKNPWDGFNQWLLTLRSKHIAVILIHHTGKSGQQRGTSAIEDHLNISIMLTHPQGYSQKDGAKFVIDFTKGRNVYGEDAENFCLQLINTREGQLKLKAESRLEGVKDMIIAMSGQGTKPKDIAKVLKCTESYVSQAKKRAVTDGLLNNNGSFTEEGERKCGKVDTTNLQVGRVQN